MSKPKKINPHNLSASDIRSAMQKRWAEPEWAIMWEVSEGTGANTGRSADAVMMSLWPSRGLELNGVEIKVSRSDWKREAKDPTKAEAIAKYCDRWWIHTPENVVDDLSDLPPAWGLREWTGKKWKTIREAEKTEAVPITRKFLAALLRRSNESLNRLVLEETKAAREQNEKRRMELIEKHEKSVKQECDRRTYKYIEIKEKIDQFEKITGRSFNDYTGRNLMQVAKCAAVLSDVVGKYSAPTPEQLEAAAEALRALDRIDSIASPSQGGE